MRSTKIKKLLQFQSMDMFTSYGHIKKPKKIIDFVRILAWASPFKYMYNRFKLVLFLTKSTNE